MSTKEETNFASSSMKIPIFDGSDRSKYQEWEDDMLAILEYHDLEEYVELAWKDKDMPSKTDTNANKILQRKEMKRAKAILVRGTKDLPNMLVKEGDTPFKAFSALQEKYKVKKVREDFDKLDSEWNDFKVSDIAVDPDLIYKTLEEQSKKLGIFGDRYSKDALQMLSKLKSALPSDYDHVFTYLNTNEERSKSFDEQLETAKAMISSHYKTKIINEGKIENPMICMVTGGASAPPNPYANITCDFCGKKGHPKFKKGKPFCFKYKKKLKQEKRATNNNSEGNADNQESGINSLFIGCSTTEPSTTNKYAWLADTGAQCHIRIAEDSEIGNTNLSIKMGNNSSATVLRRENITIADELGSTLELKQARVVRGMNTNIISILQLMNEGWKVKLTNKSSKKLIQITKNNTRLIFEEGDKKNLCFLQATIEDSSIVANVTIEDEDTHTNLTNNVDATKPSEALKNKTKAPKKCILKTWDFNDFHDKMGHHGEETLCLQAKQLGYRLIGNRNNCDACDLIKTKAKAIPKQTHNKESFVGERVGLDISGPFPLTSGRSHIKIRQQLYWYGLTDHYSRKMICSMSHDKNSLVEFVNQAYTLMKNRKTPIKCIRMDNAGENIAVRNKCKHEWGISVEHTPPDTPKLNGIQERGFAIRWEKAKILMQNAGLKESVKTNKKILTRAITTACFLTDECPHRQSKLSNNDLFYGKDRKPKVRPEHFVQWGRIGFVANKRSHTAKMKSRGVAMLFVGYALDHPSGTYEFYNPNTDDIVVSNSVKWKDFTRWEATRVEHTIGKLKNEPSSNHKETESDSDDNDSDDDSQVSSTPSNKTVTFSEYTSDIPNTPPLPSRPVTRSTSTLGRSATVPPRYHSPKVQRALKKLNTSATYKVTGNTVPVQIFAAPDAPAINVTLTDDFVFTSSSVGGMDGNIIDNDDEDVMHEQYVLHACIQSDPGEPTNWKVAFAGDEREWWIKSATSEFNNFISRKAWKFVPRKEVKEKGRKLIPTKLVFKKKDEIDGSIRFKTRDVTLGFMMIPGVDFTESFSPVATDASLRTQIAINLKNYNKGWRTRSCDVEAAFLEATMDVEMFIEPHPAMVACGFMTEEDRENSAIQLVKSMYGNVDAAIKFFKLFSNHLTNEEGMNMKQSRSDPCVFFKLNEDDELILMVSVTVDDCAITGTNENIEWFMDGVEERFNITRDDVISKHLGVKYEWGTREDGMAFCKATMDKKVNATVDYYEKYIGKPVKEYSTPGVPNENLTKYDGDPIDIDEYRSLVGKIMFFSTKVCPKIGAAIRALSAYMSCPGPDHWRAMGRLVGYMKQMDFKGVYYLEPTSYKTISLADTDYGNCKETRRSVGCSLITIGGCLVDWWMAKHHTVSDSSCEAEYKELAKCAKGVKFIQMLLGELNLLDIPGYIGEDNKGTIFLAYNKQVSQRTKHIDIKYHFIREFVEKKNGIEQCRIFKIDTKDNTADIGTKNVEVGLFNKHEFELDNGMIELREKIFSEMEV